MYIFGQQMYTHTDKHRVCSKCATSFILTTTARATCQKSRQLHGVPFDSAHGTFWWCQQLPHNNLWIVSFQKLGKYFHWDFQSKKKKLLFVFVFCSALGCSVSLTCIQRGRHHKDRGLRTITHSPREEDHSDLWKEPSDHFFCCCSWNVSSSHWQKTPFGSLYKNSSEYLRKANKEFGVISSCTAPHRRTHTHTRSKLYGTRSVNFLMLFLYQRHLMLVTLIPVLQVAAQEAALRNSGPWACLKSLSLVMCVWLAQLVCLSANWVCLHEEKKQTDIRGKC